MRANAAIAGIEGRLLTQPQPMPDASELTPDFIISDISGPPVPAAVLIALVKRAQGYTILYTERATTLRNHSGQVAFPGGRIDPEDTGADYAALREAHEEVALDPSDASVLGFMPYYFTGTNYFITPVVATVEPSRPFMPNPQEVDGVFEVPLETIIDPRVYSTYRITKFGKEHTSWQLDYDGHMIWGITANLTRRFRDMVLTGEVAL